MTKMNQTGTDSVSQKRLQTRFRVKRNFLFVVWTLLFLCYSWNVEHHSTVSKFTGSFCAEAANSDALLSSQDSTDEGNEVNNETLPLDSLHSLNQENELHKLNSSKKHHRGRYSEEPGVSCTPPGIDDFPPDLFTAQQREQGFVIVHFLVSLYIFYALALVCDDYFVPSMECICEELKMPSDVAGATFMAIATSAPELFTNIIGTFITRGDIGIGAIVGSAVFNILAVCAVCGLGAGMIIPLEWYSISRDCVFYSVSVLLLLGCLRDEAIYWYEALILVCVYGLYILGMYHNEKIKRRCEKVVYRLRRKWRRCRGKPKSVAKRPPGVANDEAELQKFQPTDLSVQSQEEVKLENLENLDEAQIDEAVDVYNDEREAKELEVVEEALRHAEEYAVEEKDEFSLTTFPRGRGFRAWVEWFIGWPIRAAYTLTIPDCREPRWRPWFPLTFMMCIVWIGILSYVVNWMMTIIGHTLKIPDSIMGLTFIAAGTSIPEVVSSLIVSRQGLGTMALSNSIGSNTFDILICLGLPWLIQASRLASDPKEPYIQINSLGLEYSALMLIMSLALLYLLLAANKYVLDRKVGLASLFLYILFVIMASLFELNVFFQVNLPTCQYHDD